jgi:hypothetical protein
MADGSIDMKWSYTASALAYAVLVCAVGGGCGVDGCRRHPEPARADAGRPSVATLPDPGPRPEPVHEAAAAATAVAAPPADGGASKLLGLDKPIEIGPAGATAAASGGAVYRTKDDDLLIAPLGRAGKSPADLEGAAIAFDPPAITANGHAYFISRGRLVRRSLVPSVGPLETLASDAHDGTLVAAHAAGARDVAAYISRPASAKADRRARLWVEGQARTYDLSEEGAGASSVALAGAGGRVWAVSLDERTAMSPLHARTVDVPDTGAPRIGPDVVVWVGPSCEAHTEIAMALPGGDPVVLAPLPKDMTSFGLAAIPIGREPHMDSVARYKPYPNGLDPAPVAAAQACGRGWVAYVRPKAAAVGSPSVLVVAPLEGGAVGDEITVAEASRITSGSFAGGTVVWWADGRSWARASRCK